MIHRHIKVENLNQTRLENFRIMPRASPLQLFTNKMFILMSFWKINEIGLATLYPYWSDFMFFVSVMD